MANPVFGFTEEDAKRVGRTVRSWEQERGSEGLHQRRYSEPPGAGDQGSQDAIEYVISTDESGTAIGVGVAGYLEIPFPCVVQVSRMVADQSCTATVDIWKDTYANFPPTDADTITAAAVPTITAGVKDEDATLTGWTTSIAAGEWLAFNVDANDNAESITISLTVFR